ncbi:MAG TPA: AbrB/MazE/SpoVT family DNA-binding domain-containing protein [Longimicrobiales bacterium]|nr:AbrB/MazE/SpoVT family DNA-binding domain-containing protein [Longimicrobiales bacterium]
MRTRIIRIGNSRGVRIPKPLLEEAGLEGEVELRLTDAGIVIEWAGRPRAGWAEAAAALRASDDSCLLNEPVPTEFDEAEWVW